MIRKVLHSIVLIAVSCISIAQNSSIINLSCDEANGLIQEHINNSDFVILDLRPESMYNVEHIENAIFHDVFAEDFNKWISNQNRDKTYLLYCNVGKRSGDALEKMKLLGFRNLYHLYQGLSEWKRQGYQTIKGNSEVTEQSKSTNMKGGAYLGLKPPGLIPEIFAPGIISTDANEFNAAFTPDGKQLFFTVTEGEKQKIMMMEYIDGKWCHRKIAPFSGIYRDVDPFISPDGKRLFFSSNRPTECQIKQDDCDFWYVEKLPNGEWSEAKYIENPSTLKKDDFYYTCTRNGVVYFSVLDDNGKGNIYRLGNNEKSGQILEFGISTDYNDHDPYIAPDESYLIFSSDRPGGFGSNDLYTSFLKDDKSWSAPTNMGKTVNSEKYDYCPILSPDGNYLFFSSSRSGNGDIYWVDASIIKELRIEALKENK